MDNQNKKKSKLPIIMLVIFVSLSFYLTHAKRQLRTKFEENCTQKGGVFSFTDDGTLNCMQKSKDSK